MEFRPNKQQGTAIFMALLIIAIVATITVLLMRTQQIDIRRTELMLTSEQAYLYSQEAIDWAKTALITDLQNPQANRVWPLVMPTFQIADGQGKITATLQDASALINLNNFAKSLTSSSTSSSGSSNLNKNAAGANSAANPNNTANNPENGQQPNTSANTRTTSSGSQTNQNQIVIANLLKIKGSQLTPEQQQSIMNALYAWVNANNPATPMPMDAYDQEYLQANPAYRSPHAPMVSVSELRMLRGMNAQTYNLLLPYVVALPITTTINTQHSPRLILQALGITSQSQQNSQSAAPTESNYFLLRTEVYLQDQHLLVYALLQRQAMPQNSQLPSVNVLWISFGTE